MAQLPHEFLTRMQDMLGDEFDAFLTSYDAPRTAGLRVNTKKCRTEDFPPLVPGTWKKIPWIPNGYFVPDGMRMGQSPLYAAGVFYLQEPSAMTPASRLPIEPGERVLDLCAAPGGKATELNARLKGTGLLVANDISNARAKALLRNLELFGSENGLGQKSPTARTRAESYFQAAVNAYRAGDVQLAISNLGKGTHYVSDLNEPHHASNLTAINSNHSAFEKYVDKNRKSYTIAGNSFGSSVYTTALNTSTGDLMYSAAKYAKGLAAEAQKESSNDSAGRKSVQHAIQTVTQYMYKFGKEVGIYK